VSFGFVYNKLITNAGCSANHGSLVKQLAGKTYSRDIFV